MAESSGPKGQEKKEEGMGCFLLGAYVILGVAALLLLEAAFDGIHNFVREAGPWLGIPLFIAVIVILGTLAKGDNDKS